MCGIIGVAARRALNLESWLTDGREAMRHRGPDDAGTWWSTDGCVGLGHRRLAIVDLSPSGHQPMRDISGRLTIVFNGEIYNHRDLRSELEARGHRFTSKSDTEVILTSYLEWGEACLARLNGMFAFALFDARERTLLIARDRAGEKPLFYQLEDGQLRFASELKGLLAHPQFARQINPRALDTYLAMGYVPGEDCVVNKVVKLPPAHALSFDLERGTCRVWRYWSLPTPPSAAQLDSGAEAALVKEFETLLEDAVHRQLEADVPVGVLLSGGVDSSLITAMAVRRARRVKTFTVGFPGFSRYDESAHAELIAKHFGTEHLQLHASDIEPDLLSILARQYDEPMVDSSMIPTYLLSRLVREHCTVALGGDGGDELFGGYAHYNRLLWTQRNFGWMPPRLGRLIASTAKHLLPTGFKGRNWVQSLGCDLQRGLPQIATFFDVAERRRLLNGMAGAAGAGGEAVWSSRIPATDDLLERATRMEFENYLPGDILVKVDRASMLNSLEVRAPLLDFRIVEFAFGRVPPHLKATATQRKILPKRLAAQLLPKQFDQRRKQGFVIPLAEWLRDGPWRRFFSEVLLDRECLFDSRAVNRLFKGQDRGRNNQERLFSLALFELWRREYRMTL